jgi:hypothetical protein
MKWVFMLKSLSTLVVSTEITAHSMKYAKCIIIQYLASSKKSFDKGGKRKTGIKIDKFKKLF